MGWTGDRPNDDCLQSRAAAVRRGIVDLQLVVYPFPFVPAFAVLCFACRAYHRARPTPSVNSPPPPRNIFGPQNEVINALSYERQPQAYVQQPSPLAPFAVDFCQSLPLHRQRSCSARRFYVRIGVIRVDDLPSSPSSGLYPVVGCGGFFSSCYRTYF